MLLAAIPAEAGNPLSFISEQFSDWKNRLFGSDSDIATAPAEGPIAIEAGHAMRIRIGHKAPERDVEGGKSRYRIVEFPADVRYASLRVRVAATNREHAFGHQVFKPVLYGLDDADAVVATTEIKPLHLDIRPFRRTRLLGCVELDLERTHRYALGTAPGVIGKSYESEVRDAIKAPTQGGFYYSTDAVKVKLPWAATGEVVLDLVAEKAPNTGC